MSGSSCVAETLVAARAWPASLTADLRALCHFERLHRAPDASPLLTRLRAVPNCRVSQLADVYDNAEVDDPGRPSPASTPSSEPALAGSPIKAPYPTQCHEVGGGSAIVFGPGRMDERVN
ncbi:hypothetical protein MRX96_051597 [Rhipicephalus microplus]